MVIGFAISGEGVMELILLERLTLCQAVARCSYLVWKQVGIREYGEINHGAGYPRSLIMEVRSGAVTRASHCLAWFDRNVAGPHVHFEVIYKDKPVDPKKFIEKHN